MTLHNIPEGAAVGVAFGALAHPSDYALSTTMAGAVALTLGIGLQNVPEGLAVAMPLRRQGRSKWRAFFFGQASALVEPVAAVLGALLVVQAGWILPYALAFAAGAMVFVAVEELIPESQSHGNTDLATMSTIVGFTVMMCLDVGLG
jgi:ZIP family zinc transporter